MKPAAACLSIALCWGGGAYTGSEACRGCHNEIYKSYRKTAMGRSMSVPQSSLPERRLTSEKLGRTFEVFNKDGAVYQSESRTGVFKTTYRLEYAVGSGEHGVTFIVRRSDHLFQAPLSFYARTGDWDLSPGYEHADYGFNRPIPAACVACHSGQPRPVEDRNGAYHAPPFRELAIGCENCHGPGAQHIKERTAGRGRTPDATIVNPARLPARLAENICMNCHQTGDARVLEPGKHYADFRPGTWLSDTLAIFKVSDTGTDTDLLEHWSAMNHSRCFVASRGKLSCMTCHDPHVAVDTPQAAAYYRARCFKCHTDASCKLPAQARGPANDCAGCHMPKREAAVISHTALTNHRIVIRAGRSPAPVRSGEPELELVNPAPSRPQPVSPLTLLEAYGQVLDRHPEFRARYDALLDKLGRTMPENAAVQAALGRRVLYSAGGNYLPALEHLEKAARLGGVTDTVQQDLAEVFARLNRLDESVTHLKAALEMEPYDPVLHKTLALRLIALKNYAAALEQMRRYVDLFPEDDFMRGLLEKASKAR